MLNTTTAQTLFFLRLPGVGTGHYWKLVDYFPSLKLALQAPLEQLEQLLPEQSLKALQEHRAQGGSSEIQSRVEQDLAWAEAHKVHILGLDHEHYPEVLRQIKRSPPVLYVQGNVECLSLPQIAMVGSRKPTPTGVRAATHFARDLARAGFTITSGLALGVDTAAHEGAVEVGGRSIAVMGTGIDKVYPARNRKLAQQILENDGALVSEFPIGTAPTASNFPQRNRIISGLSAGVLVVEAALRSGSLITARYAVQQDREVFAVPGSINNPLARGCHALIKDGAKLVECSEDIVEELQGFLSLSSEQLQLFGGRDQGDQIPNKAERPSEMEGEVLKHLDFDATSIDYLTERSGLPVGDVMATLLTMELKGLVCATGKGYSRVS